MIPRDPQNLIFISMNRWDTIQQRSHHLANSLSQTFNVLYVDPCAYSILGYVRGKLSKKEHRNLAPRFQAISSNLKVFTPPALLPFSETNQTINRLNHSLLASMVKRLMKIHGIENPILWLNYPTHVPLIGNFGELLICYDCMDNYQAFFATGSRRAKLLSALEKQMLDRAEIVTTTARSLQQKFRIQGHSAHYIPNGVGEQFVSFTPKHPETNFNRLASRKWPSDWLYGIYFSLVKL